MGLFRVSRTYEDPGPGAGSQRGFPAPGTGDQTTGDYSAPPGVVPWDSERPTKGRRSFFMRSNEGRQRGFPSPTSPEERRPAKGDYAMTARPPVYGRNIPVTTPYFSRGAAATVQNYGKVLTNPIGGGVQVLNRPQASYGPAAQYANGAIWWVTQNVPTSINLQGLTSAQVLGALLSEESVQAVVRVG